MHECFLERSRHLKNVLNSAAKDYINTSRTCVLCLRPWSLVCLAYTWELEKYCTVIHHYGGISAGSSETSPEWNEADDYKHSIVCCTSFAIPCNHGTIFRRYSEPCYFLFPLDVIDLRIRWKRAECIQYIGNCVSAKFEPLQCLSPSYGFSYLGGVVCVHAFIPHQYTARTMALLFAPS